MASCVINDEVRCQTRSFPSSLLRLVHLTLAALLCLASLPASQAQTPGTDELLRQQERERQLRLQQEPAPDGRLPQPATVPSVRVRLPAESPCFHMTHFVLEGDAAEQFQFALQNVLHGDDSPAGRCLGAAGIQISAGRIQNALVAAGFVTTRVLLAPQDLSTGELRLTVIPGRLRAVRFAPDADPRGTQWNAFPLQSGDILNLRDIEQGLENLKRVPTATADIRIEAAQDEGAYPGQSDLILSYQQAMPLRMAVSVDDAGSQATGAYQGSVTLSYDNWWTLNDLFYISMNHDLGGGDQGERGTRGRTVHYALPFSYWTVSATATRYRYFQTVAGFSQDYVYSGSSSNNDLTLSRVMYRDARRKTSVSLRGYAKESDNFIDDTEIETQRRRTAGWAGLPASIWRERNWQEA